MMAVGVVFGIIMFIVVLCILAFTIPAIVGQWKVFESRDNLDGVQLFLTIILGNYMKFLELNQCSHYS